MTFLRVLVAVVVLASLASACTSSEQNGTTTDSDNTVDAGRLRQCLEEAGYSTEDMFETPGTRRLTPREAVEEGVPPEEAGYLERVVDIDEYHAWLRTETACVEDSGGLVVRPPEFIAAQTEDAITVAECMQDRGWDYPDPRPNAFGDGMERPYRWEVIPDDREEAEAWLADTAECGADTFARLQEIWESLREEGDFAP